MAEETVIKAYLIHLGFTVDEQSLQRFTAAVAGTTEGVSRLMNVVGQLSPKVAGGIAKFAADLEGLYFASGRTGTSATHLKALDYAASNFGGSSEDARGSLQGLANYLRDSPDGASRLEGLGVQTREADGTPRDTSQVLLALGEALKNVPWAQAHEQASAMGVNDSTLMATRQDGFAQTFDEGQGIYGSLDQATLNNAHDFMGSLRDIGAQFDDLSIRVQAALEEKLGPDLKSFSAWFAENGPVIADRVAEIVVAIVGLAEKAGPYLKSIGDFLVQLDQDTDGWSSKIAALLVLLGKLGGSSVIGGIARLGATLLGLGGGVGGVAGVAALISGDTSESARKAQALEREASAGSRPAAEQLARIQLNNNPFRRMFTRITEDDVRQRADDIQARAGLKKVDDASVSPVDKGRLNSRSDGQSGQGASLGDGVDDIGASRELIERLAFYGRQFMTDSGDKAGMLLQASQNAAVTDSLVPDYYLRPADSALPAIPGSFGAVQLTQTTHINVQGSGDPLGTGNAVADAQERINQDLVRNLSGAVN
jgi:hypothetical protein